MYDLLLIKYEVNIVYLNPSFYTLPINEYFTALRIKAKKCTCRDTLMMTAKAIETCWYFVICDKKYFIHVHLLVLIHKFKYSLMHGCGTY
jgi:hypothetical protein